MDLDSKAPTPLENSILLYIEMNVDPGLIDEVKMENIKDANKKQEMYFELLREWKGFIILCVDITNHKFIYQTNVMKLSFLYFSIHFSSKILV